VKDLLITELSGVLQGFPDSTLKLNNVTRAWAKFLSFQPYHVHFDPAVERYITDEDKAPYLWKEGVIPAEWLVGQIRDSFEWMPAPVAAREIYCNGGFIPVDGLTMDKLLRPWNLSLGDCRL
jgi:hypothetical protein